jgi:hypothetical protein
MERHLRQFPRPLDADYRPAEGDEAKDADDDLERPEREARSGGQPRVPRRAISVATRRAVCARPHFCETAI